MREHGESVMSDTCLWLLRLIDGSEGSDVIVSHQRCMGDHHRADEY